MNKYILHFLMFLLLAPHAFAEEDSQPIIYSRMTLKLIPKPEPKTLPSPLPDPKPLPVQQAPANEKGKLLTKADAKKKEELKVEKVAPVENPDQPPPLPPRVPIDFNVEVKTPDFLAQTDFITHTDFLDHEGLLIMVDPVAPATITATQMISTSDVLFINEDGFITKIAPNLNLAELGEPISSGSAVKAILYLKPKAAEQDRIVPGDRFENSLFKTHPVVLQ